MGLGRCTPLLRLCIGGAHPKQCLSHPEIAGPGLERIAGLLHASPGLRGADEVPQGLVRPGDPAKRRVTLRWRRVFNLIRSAVSERDRDGGDTAFIITDNISGGTAI